VLRGLGLLVGSRAFKMNKTVIEDEARRNLVDHMRTLARRVAIAGERRRTSRIVDGDEALDLLTGLLDDKLDQSLERSLRLLKLAHTSEDMHRVHIVALTGDRHARANAIEFLDALLDPRSTTTRSAISCASFSTTRRTTNVSRVRASSSTDPAHGARSRPDDARGSRRCAGDARRAARARRGCAAAPRSGRTCAPRATELGRPG